MAASPYGSGAATRAVFVGVEGLDWHCIEVAAAQWPEWEFHLIGPWQRPGLPANVVAHGVMPFARTLPFIRHADLGLHCVTVERPEFRTMTPKVLQYTACGLPIVASSGAAAPLPHVIPYKLGSAASIRSAMQQAERFPRPDVPTEIARDWTLVAQDIAGAAGIHPTPTTDLPC